ncbi:MAG: EamA/RhaT family transporter [Betaproteobacteria bacterium]|nr:EamA/RhaT family transporter [Betaproteobacteria bacterium]
MTEQSEASKGVAVWFALLTGVAVVSTAALLIRWALQAGAAPMEIAAARLCLAALVMWPIAIWTMGFAAVKALIDQVDRSLVKWTMIAGVSLAAHFSLWISSLDYTSVASSVALVTTNPIWVALAAWLWLGEKPRPKVWMAIALSIIASLLISWKDFKSGAEGGDLARSSALWGNLLALLGAMAMSGYMLAAKAVQAKKPDWPLLAYVTVVYSLAALVLSVLVGLSTGPWWQLSLAAWPALLLLALGPQVIGHTLINHALRNLSPTVVAIAILGEPVGAALLAWFMLGESLAPSQLAGFGLVVVAILLAR